jgi:hypothetical protein
MTGLESSVKWRGATRFEQRRLRCRESTPDAYRGCAATGRIAVTGIGLPGPGSTYGQRRRARGGTQLAGLPRGSRGCCAAVCCRHVAACSRRGEIAWSTGNLQQAARVAGWTTFLLAEEWARQPGWSSTSGQQGSSYAKGIDLAGHGPRCPRGGAARRARDAQAELAHRRVVAGFPRWRRVVHLGRVPGPARPAGQRAVGLRLGRRLRPIPPYEALQRKPERDHDQAEEDDHQHREVKPTIVLASRSGWLLAWPGYPGAAGPHGRMPSPSITAGGAGARPG